MARLKYLGLAAGVTLAALAAIFIVIRLPGPRYNDISLPAFLLVLAVSFPMILLATLAIHEAGHLLGAWAAGLEFCLVTVGPWRLARELRGLRLTFVAGNLWQWQGNALCIPRHHRQLRGRLIVFVLGGPAATIGQTAVALLLRAHLAQTTLPYWLAQATLLFAYCPLAILPFTLFPMRLRGAATDAAQLLTLLRRNQDFRPRTAVNMLVAASIRGCRPRDWDETYVHELAQLPPEAAEGQIGHYLVHLHALDRQDIPLAGYHLDLALRPLANQPSAHLAPAYVLAAAALEARHGRGAGTAQAWLGLMRSENYNALAVEHEQLLWQTRAVVWLAAGELAQARTAAKRSLALLPRIIERGQAVVAQEVLEEILAATAVTLSDAADLPKTASEPDRWLAWGRSLALPLLVVTAVLIVGLLWGNGRFHTAPKQSQIYYRRGMTQLENAKFHEAVEAFSEAIRLDAGLDEAYWGRGQAYFALDQHTAAIADFDRALQLQGEQPNPWIYFYRGLSHTHLGHYTAAAADYKLLATTATDEDLRLAADHYLRELERLGDRATPDP